MLSLLCGVHVGVILPYGQTMSKNENTTLNEHFVLSSPMRLNI